MATGLTFHKLSVRERRNAARMPGLTARLYSSFALSTPLCEVADLCPGHERCARAKETETAMDELQKEPQELTDQTRFDRSVKALAGPSIGRDALRSIGGAGI